MKIAELYFRSVSELDDDHGDGDKAVHILHNTIWGSYIIRDKMRNCGKTCICRVSFMRYHICYEYSWVLWKWKV